MPQALPFIAIGLTALQVANTLSTSRQQAGAIDRQGEFQSNQLETNARISELNARSAESRGEREARETKTKTKLLIGRQRAALAAQGIEIDSGSALDLQLETAELGAVDELTIRNNAFREATGNRIESIDSRNQANFARSAAGNKSRNTIATGGLTATRQAIQGASSFIALGT